VHNKLEKNRFQVVFILCVIILQKCDVTFKFILSVSSGGTTPGSAMSDELCALAG